MLKSTYKRWLQVIKRRTKTWSKSEIQSFKNMLNRKRWADDETKKMIDELYEQFWDMIMKREELNIASDHSDQGIAYLKSLAFKKDGSIRNTKNYPFTHKQVEILREFKKFTFQGYMWASEITRDHQVYDEALVVFRVHSKSGEYFDYIPVHWSAPIVIKYDNYGYPHKQTSCDPTLISSVDEFFKVPALDSDEISPKFKEIETLFCDSSGFGRDDESAMSLTQSEQKVKDLLDAGKQLYGAITDSGQFQVHITLYERIA